MPFNEWMDKSPSNGILLSNKKEQTIDTGNNLDESQRHYAEWKKPVSKSYMPYDPT